ncbi:MAG: PKD domain-containing protein, partial [Bacteroidia bacterium]
MKIKILLAACLTLSLGFTSKAQVPSREDSLKGFDRQEMEQHLKHFKGTLAERNARIEQSKKAYIVSKYKLFPLPQSVIDARNGNHPNVETISCTNVDFEAGNTSGWTIGGANNITSGAGVDPFGNFPVVGAGAYSLQLNNNVAAGLTYTTNSTASRVISVPSTGTNFFKLSFALDVLDYPHTQAAAAKFYVKFFNASGALLPCPQYECYYYQNSGGTGVNVGVSSFQQSPCPGNCGSNIGGQTFSVSYVPWQTVAMDLTAYNGTNVTCQVICNWCIYNYDFAYCYIDAECPTATTSTVATCLALPATLSSTTGMDTYSWTAPPGNTPATATTPTINAAVAGIYTCNCTINTCSVSAYTFTYNVLPGPSPSFTNTLASACSGNISFTSTSSTNGGPPLTGYTWEWGDGTANGATANATHTFIGAGTKTVSLVITNGTCTDSISGTVTIPSHPVASFSLTNNCLNAVSNYTSTSTPTASITSQAWNFGDATSGTGATPSHTYALSGTYNVTLVVTDVNSCKDSITQPITIYPSPSVTVTSSTICLGQQTATLTASGASTYTWNTSATTATVTATPSVTTTYTVTGTDANTCTNAATGTINVINNPTITVNSGAICVGQTTLLLTANSNATTFSWAPSAGLSGTIGSPVTANPGTTTTYTIVGTAGTCTVSTTAVVTVNPLPPVTVSSSTICVGQQTATLTANGAVTYAWNPTTGLNPTSGSPVTGTPTVTTHYTVTGTDANTCTNTATSTITVNTLPPVTVTSSTICVGQQVATLTANGAVTYAWNPSATLSSGTGATVTGTPAVTTTYTITGTDANACTNTATSTITVNTLPPVTVNSSTICIGQQTATLTATGAVTYAWNPTTGLNPTSGSLIHGTPAVTTNYTVTGTDINGCVNTATFTITVNPLPQPTATSNTPCVNQQALVLNCPLNNMTSYTWSGPNSFASTTQNPTIAAAIVVAADAGTYTLVVMDNNTCTNTVTINVAIHPLPVVVVNSPTVCENQTINLTCSPNGDTYSWSGPNNIYTSSSQNPSIIAAALNMTGSYAVVVTDTNGCKNANVAQVVVNPLPVITVNTDTICLGQKTATLTAHGAVTYTWTPATTLNSITGTTVFGVPTITTNYTVAGTDNHGCVSDTGTLIFVRPLPIVAASSVTPNCIPLCTSFTATSNPAASIYTWNFSNGQSPTPTTLSPPSSSFITATCFTVAATYPINLSVTDIHGCVNTTTTIAVAYPIPVADFDYQPKPITILAP